MSEFRVISFLSEVSEGVHDCCGVVPVISICSCAVGTFCGCYEYIRCGVCKRKINGIRGGDVKAWNEGKRDVYPDGGGYRKD